MFKFYEVGGKIRDELMGLQSKDVDYVAVPEEYLVYSGIEIGVIFFKLIQHLKDEGFEIFLITPDCFTIRAKFPENHIYKGVADFVLARKEVGYYENTRQPIVVPGTLYDDLQRRDFTCNAIAKDENGTYIDPFKGFDAIKKRILVTPIAGEVTFQDDPLRLLRALRFAVTKGFTIGYDIDQIIYHFDYEEKFGVVSEERIREELYKMFKYDTIVTLNILGKYPGMEEYIFRNTKLWLKPTNEQ